MALKDTLPGLWLSPLTMDLSVGMSPHRSHHAASSVTEMEPVHVIPESTTCRIVMGILIAWIVHSPTVVPEIGFVSRAEIIGTRHLKRRYCSNEKSPYHERRDNGYCDSKVIHFNTSDI
jgi:hypothetical protein